MVTVIWPPRESAEQPRANPSLPYSRRPTRARSPGIRVRTKMNIHRLSLETPCAPYWSLRTRLADIPWKLRADSNNLESNTFE